MDAGPTLVENEEDASQSALEAVNRLYCVIGLGNPGLRYENTPHNIGFRIVDEVARRHRIRLSTPEGMSTTGTGQVFGRQVLLVKPHTFMNNIGFAVGSLLRSRRLGPRDLIVVHDELDLQWTGLKIRKKGSAAGHNGVRSVIAAVGTTFFTRVRVGIRPNHELDDPAIYVLAPWEREMKNELDEVIGYAADAVEFIVAEGALKAMAKFNRRARGILEEEE